MVRVQRFPGHLVDLRVLAIHGAIAIGVAIALAVHTALLFITGSGPGPNYSGDLDTFSQLATQLCPLPGRTFQP